MDGHKGTLATQDAREPHCRELFDCTLSNLRKQSSHILRLEMRLDRRLVGPSLSNR
jgi:hypothetical protein